MSNAKLIVKDLMSGTMKPDKIIFYVSRKPHLYDGGIQPWEMNRGSCNICEHRWIENNGPPRRIVPVVQEFWDLPETKIIIFDDDRKPSRDTVQKLVQYSNAFPNQALSIAGNIHNYTDKKELESRGVIFDHLAWYDPKKAIGIALGWAIKKPIEVDTLSPGVGMLVKPKFFGKDFLNWKALYNKDYGVDQSDQAFISYSLKKNNIKKFVIQASYVPEYPQFPEKYYQTWYKEHPEVKLRKYYRTKQIEDWIVDKPYKHHSGVSYAYFTKDYIKLRGEKWVRESFQSMQYQSDNVMVIDYDSSDNIEALTKEYGFRFFKIERTPNQFFHLSKMINKAIIEAKHDFFMCVTPDIVYHKRIDMTKIILDFYRKHDKNKECLIIQANKDNTAFRSPMMVHNRNILLKARGLDERITFYGNEHAYMNNISLQIFKLKPTYIYEPLRLLHRPHSRTYKGIGINDPKQLKCRQFSNERICELIANFDNEVKNVVNSYW